ncbi:MAG: RNA-guided endonuclease InsQ/TnpB family protein [Candidatus Hydrothermarchaeales archaeon]
MSMTTKSLVMNTLTLTKEKRRSLTETYDCYFDMAKELRGYIERRVPTRKELHEATYQRFRERGIPAQLVISARIYAWNQRKHNGSKSVTVRFDKRLHSFKETRRRNPILSVRCLNARIGVPIARDGAYSRFREHLDDGWDVTSVIMTSKLSFYAVLAKEFEEPKAPQNVLGVDVNASRLAVSIVNPKTDRILRQLYFGKDIFVRQIRYEERRRRLMEKKDGEHSSRARKAFYRLSRKQRNYVETRIWQIVGEIVRFAKEHNATIAIEDLKHLRKRKSEWSKKSRKKVNRMPYALFRSCLEHKATIEDVPMVTINPRHTSQRCPKCGHTSKKNWRGYSYFVCRECRFEANRDRVASVNICHGAGEAMPITYAQIPAAGGPVNAPVRLNEEVSVETSHV